nr:hypothetical protein [Tanacetum cinerariifolium]
MQTRSSSRLVSDQSSNPTSSTNPNSKGRNRRRSKQLIVNSNLEEHYHLVVTMADQRTMAQLLQAPTEGYEDAIVVPAITADNFELKHGLFTLVQNKQFYGHYKEDPHAHIRYFNKVTSTLKFPNVSNTSIKLMLFPFSLEGNFLDKMPRECLSIIESKSKVCYSRKKPVVAKVSTNDSTSGVSPDVAKLKDMVKALRLDKKGQNQSPAPVKAVEESCVTCGGAHSYRPGYQPLVFQQPSYQAPAYQAPAPQTQGVSKEDFLAYVKANDAVMKNMQTQAITTRSGVSYDGPQIPPLVVENEPEATKDTVASKPNPKASIPYPSRRNDERNPLIGNKEKLSEMARTPLNEHCSTVLLKKLPEKLGDPGKFLSPCDFPSMAEFLALADLGASINLMPFSMWKRLSIPDLTPTCMTLELANRSISRSVGVAEDVYVKIGSFHFWTDFVVVDFDADPRVPLILRRSFLDTGRALIDVFEEVDAFLAIEDEPTSSEFSQPYLDPEGDILLLKAFLNDDPSLPPPNQRNYMPEVCKELKIYEAKTDKSSVDKPPVVELKALPPHLEYAFLEGDDKLLVIIAKDLSVEEKTALLTVLKSHKRAIAWKLSDIKGERIPKKDKIGSKPDKNGKRGEDEKGQKQLQSVEEVKLKKSQKKGQKCTLLQ